MKDTHLSLYKNREDAASNQSNKRLTLMNIEIKRAELTKESSIKNAIFIIKIKPHENDEIWLKFEQEHQFCKWYAALKLGCKGTTMASNNYKLEIDRLQQVIKIQDISIETIENDPNKLHSVNARAFVPKKYFKKLGQNKIASHILSHQKKIQEIVKNQPTLAKMNYINVWEHIEESGRAYFQVSFKKDSKKEEYVALSAEKIMRLDPSGKILQAWWLQTLKEWKINWAAEPKRVELFLNKGTEQSEKIEFFIPQRNSTQEFNKDLQVIHEYIGGYMFHHMSKVLEPDRAEEATLRGILDVTDPWHSRIQ
jgi:kindlin 2